MLSSSSPDSCLVRRLPFPLLQNLCLYFLFPDGIFHSQCLPGLFCLVGPPKCFSIQNIKNHLYFN